MRFPTSQSTVCHREHRLRRRSGGRYGRRDGQGSRERQSGRKGRTTTGQRQRQDRAKGRHMTKANQGDQRRRKSKEGSQPAGQRRKQADAPRPAQQHRPEYSPRQREQVREGLRILARIIARAHLRRRSGVRARDNLVVPSEPPGNLARAGPVTHYRKGVAPRKVGIEVGSS